MLGMLFILAANATPIPPDSTGDHHFQHTLSTTASPETIWSIWTNVERWHEWDTGLRQAELKGDFVVGAKGRLLPDKGPKARFKVVAVEAGQSYTFKTQLPFGGLYVKRYLEVREGQTFFTHEVWFGGFSSRFFAKRLGAGYRALLPGVLEKIREMAEGGAS